MRYIVRLGMIFVIATTYLPAQTWVSKVGGTGLGNPLTYNPLNTDILYGSVANTQVYISRDRGYTWSLLGNNIPGTGAIKSIAVNPRDTSQILCGVKVGPVDKIVKSTNDGITWIQTWSGSFSYFGKPVECKPSHPDTVYTMGGDTLWRSTDFGSSWSMIRVVNGFDMWCDAELHPTMGNIMMVGDFTSGIWKTTDYGTTWYKVFATSGNGEIPSIAYDPFNTNVLYAGHYSDGGGLLKSTDGGETWFCLPVPIKPSCASTNGGNSWWVTCSPVQRGYVYFGTYGSLPSGVFLSRDSGSTWSIIDTGFGTNGVLNYGLLALDTLTVITLQSDGIYKLQYPTNIHITSPIGGERWKAGSTHTITWTSSGLYSVKIQYSENGGSSWSSIADSVPAGTGSYPWILPHTISSTCRVKILDQLFTATEDVTDTTFEIFRTPPVLLSPQGGESWEAGSVHDITWNAVPEITAMNLFYTTDNGTHWNPIVEQVTVPDSFHWTIPNTQSTQCKVMIMDATDSVSSDTSRMAFTIFATQEFICNIQVHDRQMSVDSLTFGNEPGATDGIDSSFGEILLSPKPPPGMFDARWKYGSTNGLSRDIRDTLGNGTTGHLFTGTFQAGAGGYPMTVRWDSTLLRTNTFIFRDTITHGNLVNTDMRKAGTVMIADSTLGAFEILECQSTSFAVSTNTGWNLISLPVIVGDRRSSSLFPRKTSSVFFYENNYRQIDTLSYGTGYWVKSEIETITGCRIPVDTVAVHPGWNLIGSTSFPLGVSSIVQNPPNISASQYFGYNGSGYVIVSTLEPGHGYWVKVRAAGIFILDSSNFQSPKIVQYPLSEFHSLDVSDGEGHTQEIYFGKESDGLTEEMFELPPPVPNNEFDVRFGNQRIIAMHSKTLENTINFPIFVTSVTSKIFFSWGVENEEKFTYILTKRFRGNVVEELPLVEKGTQSMSFEDGSSFAIEVRQVEKNTEVPRVYMFSEAYPNPFNPVTHIRYAIPSDSYVHIQIFSVMGEEIATLVDTKRTAGSYDVVWSGLRNDGQSVGSGVYFARLVASQNGSGLNSSAIRFSSTKKIIFLK